MEIMADPHDEYIDYLNGLNIKDLVLHCTQTFSKASILDRIAQRGRFIKIAFFDLETINQDRAVSASWARTVESIIAIQIDDSPERLAAYNDLRLRLLEQATSLGYGTLTHRIRQPKHDSLRKMLLPDESDLEFQAEMNRAKFLLGIAFGRAEDD